MKINKEDVYESIREAVLIAFQDALSSRHYNLGEHPKELFHDAIFGAVYKVFDERFCELGDLLYNAAYKAHRDNLDEVENV